MIALLVITDGRQACLRATLRSLRHQVGLHRFAAIVVVNDSLDDAFRHWLNTTLPAGARIVHPGPAGKRGFAGSIQAGWDHIPTAARFVFHLEDDFTFNRRVDPDAMCALLARHRELCQVVLKRQPCNALERQLGGIVEQHPDDYTQRCDDLAVWTEHRRFFSTNPSVYRRGLTRLRWPQEPESEGMFTHRLLADPMLRFAFWGAKHAEPVVQHIGTQRVGHGY